VNVDRLGVDLLTLSGHKLYGPKGVGVLYVRSGTPFSAQMFGGSQERGRRAGTEHVAAIAGMARAVQLAGEERHVRSQRMRGLKSRYVQALQEGFGGAVRINTPALPDSVAPNIVSVSIRPTESGPVDGEMLLLALDMDGICVSAGSACTSGTLAPSHVLAAIGVEPEAASATVRVSFGMSNSEADVDYVVERLHVILKRMGVITSGRRAPATEMRNSG